MGIANMIMDSWAWCEHLMICDQCTEGEVSDTERCEIGKKLAERVIASTKEENYFNATQKPR